MAGLSKRLAELGWVEGRNLQVHTRWAEGQIEGLPRFMAEMVERKVDVILTSGTPAAIAAKNATKTIPIVVASIGDPVGSGLVPSLANPGGNLTEIAHGWTEGFSGKWLELLHDSIPRLITVTVIFNPNSPLCVQQAKELETTAKARNLNLRRIEVRKPELLENAFRQTQRACAGGDRAN